MSLDHRVLELVVVAVIVFLLFAYRLPAVLRHLSGRHCPTCGGTGRVSGYICPVCGGNGKVI